MTKMIEPNIEKILKEQDNREKVVDSIKAAKAILEQMPEDPKTQAP
jgi:hypothetical protein